MNIILGFLLSIIGLAYIVYAKKSTTLSFAISGASLTIISFLPIKLTYTLIFSLVLLIFPFLIST